MTLALNASESRKGKLGVYSVCSTIRNPQHSSTVWRVKQSTRVVATVFAIALACAIAFLLAPAREVGRAVGEVAASDSAGRSLAAKQHYEDELERRVNARLSAAQALLDSVIAQLQSPEDPYVASLVETMENMDALRVEGRWPAQPASHAFSSMPARQSSGVTGS